MNNADRMLEIMKGAPLKIQGEVFLSHCRALLSLGKRTKTTFHKLDSPKGVRVTRNSEGLYQGDIITQVNGRPVKTISDMDDFLKGISPGKTVTLTVLRKGAVQQVPHRTVAGHEDHMATQYGIRRLMDYGMLAAYAGYPDLTRAAAREIFSVQNQFPADLIPSFARQTATILNALADAMEQAPDSAYQALLACGKLHRLDQRYILDNSKYYAPLFASPKKIAYLLGKEVSDLPKVPPFPIQKQAYLTLDGKQVQPGAQTFAQSWAGSAPPAAPKVKATAAQRPGIAPFEEDTVFDGLYAWFPLDGDAEDIGPNHIRAEVHGPVPAEDCLAKNGRALFFDGKDDFIKLLMDINPSKMPQLSVALQFMPEREWGVLFCHDNGNWDRSITYENLKEIKGLTSLAGPMVKWFGGIELPQNRWHLAIATWNAATGKASLYTQTQKFEAITANGARPGEGWPYVQLGKSPSFGGEFLGRMDNVVVWDRELSYGEAKRLIEHPELIDNAPRLTAVRELDEGIKLFQAGFFEAGAKQYAAALAYAGTQISGRRNITRIREDMKGVPLHLQGEVVLSHYRALVSRGELVMLDFSGVDDPKGLRVTQATAVGSDGVRLGDIVTQIDGWQIKNQADLKKYLHTVKAPPSGTRIPVTVIRNNTVLQTPSQVVTGLSNRAAAGYAVSRLAHYGMLAAYAGHPAMTRAAALEISSLQKRFPSDVLPYAYKETTAILNALATAMEQGPDAGYRILLDCGKLHPVTRRFITELSPYFAPLYATPKKLAYLLDTPVSKLPKPKPFPAEKQAFVSLDGRRIGPGDGVPALSGSGSPQSAVPKPAPKAKGTVLD